MGDGMLTWRSNDEEKGKFVIGEGKKKIYSVINNQEAVLAILPYTTHPDM